MFGDICRERALRNNTVSVEVALAEGGGRFTEGLAATAKKKSNNFRVSSQGHVR